MRSEAEIKERIAGYKMLIEIFKTSEDDLIINRMKNKIKALKWVLGEGGG